MKTILKLTIIILMALFSFKSYGQESQAIYELILDFGNDNTFIHEVTKYKWYCEARVKYIVKRERVKAYCLKRQ